ncbi:MAG TPA: hypothetical protein VGV39_01045 [Mesorhizobium sp.]|jgi:hypothetical protein|uniref:hypothetical protein n=1 Tax=Mesorhizobium sp. TaxID=1871066 RepID=UPI002DDCF743|nr:hypothetical protein [Mesorhizobium sp.]HEV2501628.1 hypothetical protein [Mesorhizobium sp.]
MSTRRRTGRVKIDFSVIERFAASELGQSPLAKVGVRWTLSKASSLHRRKDGTYTLCLIWKSVDGLTLNSTKRGLRLERQ